MVLPKTLSAMSEPFRRKRFWLVWPPRIWTRLPTPVVELDGGPGPGGGPVGEGLRAAFRAHVARG